MRTGDISELGTFSYFQQIVRKISTSCIRTTEPSCVVDRWGRCIGRFRLRRPAGSGYSLKRVVKLPGSNLGRGDKTKEDGRAEMNERTTVREHCNLWLKLATQKRFREPRGGKKERKRAWYIL